MTYRFESKCPQGHPPESPPGADETGEKGNDMKKSTQAELWSQITGSLSDLGLTDDIADKANEYDELLDKMNGKFAKTLTEEQRGAFNRLLDMHTAAKSELFDVGLVAGALLSNELRALAESPIKAHKDVASRCSVKDICHHEIECLEEYFKTA